LRELAEERANAITGSADTGMAYKDNIKHAIINDIIKQVFFSI
jgi:hypothetical protein